MKIGTMWAVVVGLSSFLGGQQLPPVPGKIFDVTPTAGFENEPAIAVNGANPQQVVAAYQMPARVVYSQDGGQSWKAAEATASTDYKISGDVVLTYGKKGAAILCYIAFDKLGTENYWAHGATRNGIFVRRSDDGGATWGPEQTVIAQPTKSGIPFEDKPGMVADTTDGKYAGSLYVGWTEFRLDETVILFARSTDGGKTWSQPVEISTHHGLPRDDNGAVEGFSATVGSDGTVYTVWGDADGVAFTSSHDGGKTFAKSKTVIKTAPLYFGLEGLDRANGFPQIGIDPKHGKKGRLFVTWSDYRNGDVGVYCATSDDGGKKWSNAVRVNSNPPHDGTDQFFQWLAVDPASGAANVIFYDRRSDPSDRKTSVTLGRSVDGGKTFENYAWSDRSFTPSRDDFLGDYIGVAALNGKVYGAWAETSAGAVVTQEKGKDEGEQRMHPHTVVRVGVGDFGGK